MNLLQKMSKAKRMFLEKKVPKTGVINSQILAAARKRAVNPDAVPSADVQALHFAYAALEAVAGRKPEEASPISEKPVIALGIWSERSLVQVCRHTKLSAAMVPDLRPGAAVRSDRLTVYREMFPV